MPKISGDVMEIFRTGGQYAAFRDAISSEETVWFNGIAYKTKPLNMHEQDEVRNLLAALSSNTHGELPPARIKDFVLKWRKTRWEKENDINREQAATAKDKADAVIKLIDICGKRLFAAISELDKLRDSLDSIGGLHGVDAEQVYDNWESSFAFSLKRLKARSATGPRRKRPKDDDGLGPIIDGEFDSIH